MHRQPRASRTPRSVRAAAGAALLPFLLTAAATAQDWTLHAATGPSARQLPRMVYDLARSQMVLFGGYSRSTGAANAETWLFDGVNWAQALPATTPPPRDTHCMSYDLARGVVVMFGGVDSGNFPSSIANDTWEWNGSNWTLRAPAAAPSPRFGMAMAFDSTRNVHVLFGGSTASGNTSETWEWNGSNWLQPLTATVPPARGNHCMSYDTIRGRVVMFGGRGSSGSLGDTWEYDGVDWQQVSTASAPAARTGAAMAYDLLRGVSVLYGGLTGTATRNNETWEYDGRDWYRYQLNNTPVGGGRTNAAMGYMPSPAQIVLFGGAAGSDQADTWTFGGALPSVTVFGAGCAGSAGTPTLAATSLPALGSSFGLTLGGVPASGFTVLVAALGGTTDLVLPGTSCHQRVLPPWFSIGAFATGGTAVFALPVANDPALAGLVVHFQGAALDSSNPLGVILSNGLRARVD